MCEYCDQLQRALTPSPVTACPVCARPLSATDTPHTCARCILYALIHQNTFAQRWNEIQQILTTTRPQQIHPSLNDPQPVRHTTPPRPKDTPSDSTTASNTVNTQTTTRMVINLALTTHTLQAIQQILIATPASRLCTTTHISHPTLPLSMTQLHKLNSDIHSIQDQSLSLRILYHHLSITAISIITPSDRTLKITIDNTTHTLTPPRKTNVAAPNHLHLYLNPHNRLPYLQHTCPGPNSKPHCLIVTTSLPSRCPGSSSTRRRPMMRTTSHAPDLITTLTFPADSVQHQQSILTLVTHMILTIPVITPRQSWNIIRDKDSHRHTLQLILATVTLKRHHLIWHTAVPDLPVTHTTPRSPPETFSNKPKRRAVSTPTHHPPKRQRQTRS